MDTLITRDETISNPYATTRYIEATCGRIEAIVSISDLCGVRVCCKNASASLTRFMGGRTFRTVDDAIAGYKSAEMRSILSYAKSRIA
jgi:hypothetical protein